MIDLLKIVRKTLIILALILTPFSITAEQLTVNEVTIDYDILADGTAKLKYAINKSPNKVMIKIDGNDVATLSPGHINVQSVQIKRIAFKTISVADSKTSGTTLWRYKTPAPVEIEEPSTNTNEKKESTDTPINESQSTNTKFTPREVVKIKSPIATEIIDKDAFFGTVAVTDYLNKVNDLTKGLSQSKNKEAFLEDNDISGFLKESEAELITKKNDISNIAEEAVSASQIADSDTRARTLNLLIEILNWRYNQRQSAYDKLRNIVDSTQINSDVEHSLNESIINYTVVGVILLVLIIWIIIAISKKNNKAKNKQKTVKTQSLQDPGSNNQDIVVRRRTTSILKKQCIDDVFNNPSYMVIHSSDFTPDSAVRDIYIKNTCIKEVYNLYAEDLRRTENPKEDGCMVVGRWVYDESNHTYDISLEEVVFPGDDAVFKEYELNFGGKIKLRIAEKLRKLRRDTNLQYDLVCWIHSHPGLGVFFSNSDDNVQMQLKHSQHPNFLIAFVVDILTSDQEMGIFTFRRDGSMNSKGDLTKMYSLEEMYKWALQSERNSFSHNNYFNILENAKLKMPSCNGVELNNSSIIDLTQIVIEPETGVLGWAVGTTVESNSGQEFVVSSIVRNIDKPNTGIIGCLISMTHTSFPTIQRLIGHDSVNISFVMVYSTKQMSLTTIPVINGEILADEQFYGDVNIDDLKIWTRRKR